ncbi:hypothetical protein FOA19_00955 [Rufibacter hautae]|uniref:Uncharacterized protein n=1 Tax=Rufibacter hautae TaxID=2595005 RepID=A0A5B6TG86_9BACT|nr:hypothetical protein FOA19_00955 [Rufibacter hautae]
MFLSLTAKTLEGLLLLCFPSGLSSFSPTYFISIGLSLPEQTKAIKVFGLLFRFTAVFRKMAYEQIGILRYTSTWVQKKASFLFFGFRKKRRHMRLVP